VNLHFRDERSLTVDIDAIVGRGRRMRRNRRVLAGTVATVVIGTLGLSAAAYQAPVSSLTTPVIGAAPSTSPQHSPDELDSILAGGGHVTVIGSRPNAATGYTLSAVAWRAGPQICYGIADVAGSKVSSTTTCANRPAALSATTPTVLAPRLITGVRGDPSGTQVAVGFVSGDVAKVSLKIRGQVYDAPVVALPGSPGTGAYVVWIPKTDPATSARDFTQITGYDSHGATVTG
jgi:hypothetical protein